MLGEQIYMSSCRIRQYYFRKSVFEPPEGYLGNSLTGQEVQKNSRNTDRKILE
jgi:hypothetical protein